MLRSPLSGVVRFSRLPVQSESDDGAHHHHEHGQVDDRALIGLEGVLKISYATIRGLSLLNLDAFAPASSWRELSAEGEPEVKKEKKRDTRRQKAS